MCGPDRFQEKKLVALPAGSAGLWVEVRRFEAERGVGVGAMRVGVRGVMRLAPMVEEMGLELDVEMDEDVREGHVVLVGTLRPPREYSRGGVLAAGE